MQFEKEVLEHLSKEIVTNTKQMMTFRSRIAFTPWIGPLVIIGAYLVGTKERPATPHWDKTGIILLAVGTFLFIGMGWVLAEVERHTWDQCNKWRELIARIHAGLQEPLRPEELRFEHYIRLGYFLAAVLVVAVFFLVIIAAVRILS